MKIEAQGEAQAYKVASTFPVGTLFWEKNTAWVAEVLPNKQWHHWTHVRWRTNTDKLPYDPRTSKEFNLNASKREAISWNRDDPRPVYYWIPSRRKSERPKNANNAMRALLRHLGETT